MQAELGDIRERIRAGRFVNEAAISQGVVRRILDALDWPVYDTDVVAPEYSVQGRRVDYALCHPPGKPKVFIEVKQPGQSGGADRQLFEYAFHPGVPMVVLTDGQEWHFYLPGEEGDYGERRVYKLDILEREPEESVDRLQRYLHYRAVCSGEAIASARRDYLDVARERQIRETLPEAWRQIIEDADELLLELIADKTESLCGFKPQLDMVAAFLSQHSRLAPTVSRAHLPRPQAPSPHLSTSPVRQPEPSKPPAIGFTLDGRTHAARNAQEVLLRVLLQLAERDSTFLDRFAALPKHGRKRRYLARAREDLYPDRADLVREASRELRPGSGWWVGVNVSRQQIERILEMACEVAGLRYGSDLRVNLG